MGKQLTKEALCDNVLLCLKYNFLGSQYVTYYVSNGGNQQFSVSSRSQYDPGAIMHYSSEGQSNDRCKHGTINECILVKYIKDNSAKGVKKILMNTKVTSRDANWVGMVYS
jgi:hypothetical protein